MNNNSMATFYKDGDPACDHNNWDTSQKPSSFAPSNLNISNWIENYKAVGCKSGILTAKHGCAAGTSFFEKIVG